MKKIIAMSMVFLMLFGTAAFAEMEPSRKELDVKEKKVYTEDGKIKISIEGGYHLLDYRYVPERKILIELPEDGRYTKEKLYFEIRGESATLAAESEAKLDFLKEGTVVAVPLKDAENSQILLETEIGYLRKAVEGGTEFSLWLLGGNGYKNNLLTGKEDILLRGDFVWMKDNTPKKMPTEVLLTVGKETIQFNGAEKYILVPIRRNADGQIMMAAKDLGIQLSDHRMGRNNRFCKNV